MEGSFLLSLFLCYLYRDFAAVELLIFAKVHIGNSEKRLKYVNKPGKNTENRIPK